MQKQRETLTEVSRCSLSILHHQYFVFIVSEYFRFRFPIINYDVGKEDFTYDLFTLEWHHHGASRCKSYMTIAKCLLSLKNRKWTVSVAFVNNFFVDDISGTVYDRTKFKDGVRYGKAQG